MKIRNGFVSNSSSTSYVILVPNNFNVDDFVYANLKDIEKKYQKENTPWRRKNEPPAPVAIMPYDYIDKVIISIKTAIKQKSIYGEDNYEVFSIIHDLMGDLIIGRVEGGPDQSSISFVSENTIFDKLNSFEQKSISEEEKQNIKNKFDEQKIEYDNKRKKRRSVDPYDEEEWED